MKKHLLYLPLLTAIFFIFTSCGNWDYWAPDLPPNSYSDPELTGTWELYQVNSEYVRGEQVNYMQFYGNGRGMYYYYERGYRKTEKLAYWCQRSVSGTSSRQVNIQYEYGNPSTMNYWFTDGYTLWMQWRNEYGVQTYVYKLVRSVPW